MKHTKRLTTTAVRAKSAATHRNFTHRYQRNQHRPRSTATSQSTVATTSLFAPHQKCICGNCLNSVENITKRNKKPRHALQQCKGIQQFWIQRTRWYLTRPICGFGTRRNGRRRPPRRAQLRSGTCIAGPRVLERMSPRTPRPIASLRVVARLEAAKSRLRPFTTARANVKCNVCIGFCCKTQRNEWHNMPNATKTVAKHDE